MEKAELASSNFRQGFACSQSVLLAFADEFGLTSELAARISSGFGGGLGRTGRTCGAVSGGLMVLGLAFGAISAEDAGAKEETYARVRQFLEEFSQVHGTLECNTLLCADIGTPEGRSQARAQGKFSTLCPLLVSDAARITAKILLAAERANR